MPSTGSFGFIRPLLTRKNENGTREYTDRWPTWLDLEEAVYRPLCAGITRLTTWICGGISYFGSEVLPAACRFLLDKPIRLIASLPDAAASLAEKTVLRRIPIPAENPADSRPEDLAVPDVVPKKAVNIVNSFSYGLILFGTGLIAVLLYLIFT